MIVYNICTFSYRFYLTGDRSYSNDFSMVNVQHGSSARFRRINGCLTGTTKLSSVDPM